jgi:hypothetical protein
MRASEVFVAGGFPHVTYVPRDELQLESSVREYLDERFRVLSLSGPTKSGKTVLIKNVVPDAIWVSGGDISGSADFWRVLVDRLDGWMEIQKERTKISGETLTSGGKGEVSAVVAKGEVSVSAEDIWTDTRSHTVRRDRPAQQVALELLNLSKPPVVIDDFHYLADADQVRIIRGLRSAIFDGLPVILLSVPHRAYDAVRAEPEMVGRLIALQIPFWTYPDLQAIGKKGFEALNVRASNNFVKRLASNSLGSPFLMQHLCLQLCKERGVRETLEEPQAFEGYVDDKFFLAQIDKTSELAFQRLEAGPRARTKRIGRKLRDGREVDIYGLVLAAIASTGPKRVITEDGMRSAVRHVSAGNVPERNEVTRVLEEMTKIARGLKGEPVLDYISEERRLYLADPFFAYYLRWTQDTRPRRHPQAPSTRRARRPGGRRPAARRKRGAG